MRSIDKRPRIGGLLTVGALLFALGVPLTAFGEAHTVTICHASGQEGGDQFVTLTLAYAAAYGNAGHFHEDGTTRAGHEADYLGACEVDPTTTTLAETTTTTLAATTTTLAGTTTTLAQTTTTTLAGTTTTLAVTPTTLAQTTTTTVPETTTTTVPETTTTTVPETTTTTVPQITTTLPSDDQNDLAARTGASPDDEADASPAYEEGESTPVAASSSSEAASSNSESNPEGTLPYTGFEDHLAVPASLMLIAGAFAIFVTRGFGLTRGAHASIESNRFGLGLHRGRHESGSL